MNTPSCRFSLLLACLALLGAADGQAQTPECDALPAGQRALAQDIFTTLHPYDGCDETFARCLLAKPPQPIVLRLASDLCRQVKAGTERKQIERNLAKRAQTMLATGPRAGIALDPATRAGAADAPVTVVVYACSRCPLCQVMVPALYQAVTDGPLAGKARLYLRPFPLKSHKDSTEGGLAFMSAAKLERFWPLVLRIYQDFDRFCPSLLPDWAEAAGLDRTAFEREYADARTRAALVAAKQEGLRNQVSATPSIFIDGRPYLGEMTREAVIDVLEECYQVTRRPAARDARAP
jgi:protein-disulfide isomerase